MYEFDIQKAKIEKGANWKKKKKKNGQRFQLISCVAEKRLKHDLALFPLL